MEVLSNTSLWPYFGTLDPYCLTVPNISQAPPLLDMFMIKRGRRVNVF